MEMLSIPNCNFANIDYQITLEMLVGLDNIFKRYPLLRHKIDAIGENTFIVKEMVKTDKRINHINTSRYNKSNDDAFFKTIYTWLGDFSKPEYYIKSNVLFIGLGINSKYSYDELEKQIALSNKMGNIYAWDIKTSIYHEIGHVFDLVFLLGADDVFMQNIRKFMSEKRTDYSIYSLTNEHEFIAECFCKYMTDSNFNEAVNYVGTTIDEYYEKYKSEHKFNENAYREKVLKIKV